MLSLAERQQNVRGAFQIVGSPSLSGRHLLIVDDVVTSVQRLTSLPSSFGVPSRWKSASWRLLEQLDEVSKRLQIYPLHDQATGPDGMG